MLMGGNQPLVSGVAPTFDTSQVGLALRYLYAPCVATVQQQFEWDAARKEVNLTLSGNAAQLGFAYEYLYPTNGVQVWQIRNPALADSFNPVPENFVEGNAIYNAAQVRVLWTNVAAAKAIYNNNPTEDNWSPGFREAIVRLLASELALAIAGRPDTAQGLLDSASGALSGAKTRAN